MIKIQKMRENGNDNETPQALLALTSRELEIFNLLLNGVSPKEIAYNLNVNYKTVDVHRSNLYRKLCVHSIQELVVKYSSYQIKTDGASSGETTTLMTSENRPAKGRRLKIFVLVGIAIAALSLIGYFFIKSPAKKKCTGVYRVRCRVRGPLG